MNLSTDVIGTNPKYLPIVDHTWLNVDLSSYDNFPSDNNPVRVVPKLSELWNPPQAKNSGLNLVPNRVCPLSVQKTSASVDEIVKEAKKAMMSGLYGRKLADYLKACFSVKELVKAKDELAKLAGEQGLLGNVYVDLSAFSSYNEAERFFTKHRSRLARDMVVKNANLSQEMVNLLANKFRKNVVPEVKYDDDLLSYYKNHLVMADKIDKDFVIDSKESLRQAFLYQPQTKSDEPTKQAEVRNVISDDELNNAIKALSEEKSRNLKLSENEVEFRRLRPIIVYAREQLAKGKTGNDLKEILRSKYAKDDLNSAAIYLTVVVSDKGLELLNRLVKENEISEWVADELKEILETIPVKKSEIKETKSKKTSGGLGYFYVLSGKKETDNPLIKGAVKALQKGYDINRIRKAMLQKMPLVEVDKVLTAALVEFNSLSAGVKANQPIKAKKPVIEDNRVRQTLPDPAEIPAKIKELQAFFAKDDSEIPIDNNREIKSPEILNNSSRAGIDELLKE